MIKRDEAITEPSLLAKPEGSKAEADEPSAETDERPSPAEPATEPATEAAASEEGPTEGGETGIETTSDEEARAEP